MQTVKLDQEDNKTDKKQSHTGHKSHPQSQSNNPFSRAIQVTGKVILALIPFLLLVAALPYALWVSSSIIQPFFQAANFTINGTSEAFSTLKKEPTLMHAPNGNTNILIVGIDTRAKGSRLLNTDTIILASYNPKSNDIAMLSFPRDLNVNYPNTPSIGKINATYAYGEMRKPGGGMEYLRQLIQSISGQKIQYYVMVDLKGFQTIIDQLGGVDVNVDTAFTGRYPTKTYGWMNVKFKKGKMHMDGNVALQFARVRHAFPGVEASDFARARRQQKIIQAVIDKATKAENLQNVKTIFDILGTVATNVKINRITPEDIQAGLNILKNEGKPVSSSLVLDPAAGGFNRLIKRGSGYLYTLRPSAGVNNWSQVKAFVKDYFSAPALPTANTLICVYNGGTSSFSSTYRSLTSRFYYADFKNCGNTTKQDKGTVYNLGGSKYESSAKFIASTYKLKFVDATDTSVTAPRPKDGKIVIVLGK